MKPVLPKPKVVPDWRDWWRWYSNHSKLLVIAAMGAWTELPPEWKAAMPAGLVIKLAIVVLVLGIVGSVIEQVRKPGGGA